MKPLTRERNFRTVRIGAGQTFQQFNHGLRTAKDLEEKRLWWINQAGIHASYCARKERDAGLLPAVDPGNNLAYVNMCRRHSAEYELVLVKILMTQDWS